MIVHTENFAYAICTYLGLKDVGCFKSIKHLNVSGSATIVYTEWGDFHCESLSDEVGNVFMKVEQFRECWGSENSYEKETNFVVYN